MWLGWLALSLKLDEVYSDDHSISIKSCSYLLINCNSPEKTCHEDFENIPVDNSTSFRLVTGVQVISIYQYLGAHKLSNYSSTTMKKLAAVLEIVEIEVAKYSFLSEVILYDMLVLGRTDPMLCNITRKWFQKVLNWKNRCCSHTVRHLDRAGIVWKENEEV